jgi:hypothetical protein
MTDTWAVIDAAFMLLCASMYLGTGWSLVLFSFPIAPRLTPENYALPFVEPVTNATRFFTWMTTLMMAAAVALIVAEWSTGYVWVPIVYLAAAVAATGLTIKFVFPYNREMKAGITDPGRLRRTLGRWMRLNVLRVLLWTVEWVVITLYFALKVA